MDTALQFLLDYGYVGMFLAAFLAGSILPFSSEALLVAFVEMGVKPEKLARAERFIRGRGAWMAFFSFLPVVGDGIAIVLGLMRANLPITLFSMTLGKLLRYVALVLAAQGINILIDN